MSEQTIDELWRIKQGKTAEQVWEEHNFDPNKITLCGCMGPVRGDPYCYCTMLRKGLEPTPTPPEELERLNKALVEMYKWETK